MNIISTVLIGLFLFVYGWFVVERIQTSARMANVYAVGVVPVLVLCALVWSMFNPATSAALQRGELIAVLTPELLLWSIGAGARFFYTWLYGELSTLKRRDWEKM